MLESLREVVRYRSLLRNLVARDLKVRYKRSALGILWTMLNPLLLMIIFTIVFAHILRVTVDHFTVYFLSAFAAVELLRAGHFVVDRLPPQLWSRFSRRSTCRRASSCWQRCSPAR